jgi:hypothetical protein
MRLERCNFPQRGRLIDLGSAKLQYVARRALRDTAPCEHDLLRAKNDGATRRPARRILKLQKADSMQSLEFFVACAE